MEKISPDKSLTEEQKVEIDAIDRRFYRRYFQAAGIIAIVLALIVAFIPFGNFIQKCLFLVIMTFFGILSTSNWAVHRFIRCLSHEERKLINHAESGSARSALIMNVYNDEKELLRASQLTETDTNLLRAATHAYAHEDLLLHPSQKTEE